MVKKKTGSQVEHAVTFAIPRDAGCVGIRRGRDFARIRPTLRSSTTGAGQPEYAQELPVRKEKRETRAADVEVELCAAGCWRTGGGCFVPRIAERDETGCVTRLRRRWHICVEGSGAQ